MGLLVNETSFDRMISLIENCKGEVLIGGVETILKKGDKNYISPTVIKNPSLDSKLMTEEIFGPILPVLTFKDFSEVIDKHIKAKEKPLAIYYFGNASSENFQRLQDETSSGNLSANDVLHHAGDIELGFGGVGHSGMGRIGGYESFKQMSNARSIVLKW